MKTDAQHINPRRQAGLFHAFRPGFTLIELLVVISIMALVMGLVVGLVTTASRTMKLKRVEGDLQNYVTAIENYHAEFGFYPPDNVVATNSVTGARTVNASTNQLYYELTGWNYSTVDPNQFLALTRQGPLYTKTVQTFFHTLGFVNSSSNPKESPRNFLPNLNASQVGQIPSGTAGMVDSFIVPVKGPSDIIEYNANGKRTGRLLNTWRYVSSSPTNNPGSFDLWAEIVIGRETKIIGNWKE